MTKFSACSETLRLDSGVEREEYMNRIGVFLESSQNRVLLVEWLSRWYDVFCPGEKERELPLTQIPSCALWLMDGPTLKRRWQEIAAYRRTSHSPIVPVALLTPNINTTWLQARLGETVDDVIRLPLAQWELRIRIEHLLRLHNLTQEGMEVARLQAERSNLEAQLFQAQRLENVGLLVSGVAHDVNNVFTGIKGHVRQGRRYLDSDHPGALSFEHIDLRVDQGARLTRQLLSFARGRKETLSQINLQSIISDLQPLLTSALGRGIKLTLVLGSSPLMIAANPTQVEQILMNLCLNARDAMPDGGNLNIDLQSIHCPAGTPGMPADIAPGWYARMQIDDTGVGMDEQVQKRLFEAFFTTKGEGKGTGLGLATVARILNAHQGWITVESTSGKGTSFCVYLPLVREPEEKSGPEIVSSDRVSLLLEEQVLTPVKQEPAAVHLNKSILIIEDDPDIQMVLATLLEEAGYSILQANTGNEVRRLCEQHGQMLSLIIADLMIPQLSPAQLEEIVSIYAPQAPVLVTSGHQKQFFQEMGLHLERTEYLQKPYDLDTLLLTVQMLLDESDGQAHHAELLPANG
jgi:two-component system cell cycle sensor histidine kinase/response regulator CckA